MGYTGSRGAGYTGSTGLVGAPTSNQYINADGVNSIFTMNVPVTDPNNIFVFINGIVQTPTIDYTVSGTTLTFTFVPSTNSAIEIRFFGIAQGLTGYRGSLGDSGYTGSMGSVGYQGSIGFTGSSGTSGYTGSIGYAGTIGYTGSLGYTGSAGAGYTGSAGPAGAPTSSQSITADGTNNSFTMSQSVSNPNYVLVTINGLLQIPTTDYTVSGTNITFAFTPINSAIIELRYFGEIGSEGYQGSVGFQGSAGVGYIGSLGFTGSIGYTGSRGAGYTGSMGPVGAPSDYQVFVGDGVSTSFTMKNSVPFEAAIIVAINGLIQIPITDYTVSGTNVNFNFVPNNLSEIEIRYFEITEGFRGSVGYQGSAGTPGTGYWGSVGYTGSIGYTGSVGIGLQGPVGAPQDNQTFIGTGSTSSFTMNYSIVNESNIIVTINGLVQIPVTDYTVSGNTLSFTVIPPNNTNIEVRYFTIAAVGYSGSVGYKGSVGDPGGSTGYTGSIGFTGSIGIGFTGSIGIGYTGSAGVGVPYDMETQTSSSNQTVFILKNVVAQPGNIFLSVNGLLQTPILDYNISNSNTLTLTTAPALNSVVEVRYFAGTGYAGSQGYNGSAGFQGSVGVTGSQGSVGYQGSVGFQGSASFGGYQGSIGFQGSQGNIGNQGTIGFQGSQGDQGLVGFQGSQGNIGTQGDVGYQGSAGFAGSIGNLGGTGYQGSVGAQGSGGQIGPTGLQGNIGFQGSSGYRGSVGAAGAGFQGSLGFQGSIGSVGYQGSSGASAAAGYQGSVGFQGSI